MKYRVLIFLIVINLGCNSKNAESGKPAAIQIKHTFFTINIPDLWKNQREVLLSEIADTIEYIPLETSRESLLDFIHDVRFAKDFIFVAQSKGPLAQFDRSGKFIRCIGRLGRGPEEYGLIRNLSIDEEHRRIFIQSNSGRVVQVFSFEGAYIQSIHYPEDYKFIEWSRDSLLVFYHEPTRGIEKYVFEERNFNNEIIQTVNNNFFWQNNNSMSYSSFYSMRNVFYRLNNHLYFKGSYNDTVYTFNTDNKISPAYFLELGHSRLPDELRTEVTGEIVTSPGYYWASAKESSRYIFIVYSTYSASEGKITDYGLICYDKSKNQGITLIDKKDKTEFINDLDGGLDFSPEYVNDSLAFVLISASRMRKYLDSEDSSNASSLKKDQKRMLKMTFSSLDENDNPIIMLVKLKS